MTTPKYDKHTLSEVIKGIYRVDVTKEPTIQDEAWANQFDSKAEAFWHGEQKALQNIAEHIAAMLYFTDEDTGEVYYDLLNINPK